MNTIKVPVQHPIRCLLLTSVSTCFGHHYAHLQENKGPISAFGVLFWFCWMWLVAVVGRCLAGCEHYEGFCAGSLKIYVYPYIYSVSVFHNLRVICTHFALSVFILDTQYATDTFSTAVQ